MSSVAGGWGRNPDLDGLRGLAALSVALGHCYVQVTGLELWTKSLKDFPSMPHDLVVARILSALFPSDAAVMVFFVLSGHVLWESFSHRKLWFFRDLPDYVAARLYRLLPLTIVTALPLGFISTVPARELVANMLLFSHSMNGVLWSLQAEMVGSGMLFVVWCVTRGTIWKMLVALAISVVVLPFGRGNLAIVFLPAFILGAGITSMPGWLRRNRPLLVLGILLLLFTNIFVGHGGPGRLIEMGAATAVVSAVSQGALPFLRRRVPLFLGAISYPFYLTHVLGMIAAQPLLDMLQFSSPYLAFAARAALSIPPVILLAWALHVLIEVPAQRGRPRLRWAYSPGIPAAATSLAPTAPHSSAVAAPRSQVSLNDHQQIEDDVAPG
jgi:peptidoglycan/LPS O-acetylase OafA/YrhL